MATLHIIILTLSFAAAASAHNITAILNEFPEYSVYNNYLTQTRLADEINARETITVLVFNNIVAAEYLTKPTLSLSTVKVALSIHALLDYFDLPKLQEIGDGSVITTTLYQTTGTTTGNTGFVNITDLASGKVGFGSQEGSRLDALFYKSVKQIPYNISVLEITSPILAPGVLDRPPALDLNMTNLLEKAGCKTFARLISESGALRIYETAEAHGLTVFAPSDAAFTVRGLPDFNKLSSNTFVSVMLYHAIPKYAPKVSLMSEKDPVKTLASNQVLELGFSVRSKGDSVTLSTGVVDAHVEGTVLDSVPLSVLKIDHVLLPVELFPKPPSGAPAPVPETTPPAPTVPGVSPPAPLEPTPAPAPGPVVKNSPAVSPPAPAPGSGPAPADGPTADGGNSKSDGGIKAPVMFLGLVAISVWVMFG